MPSSRRPLWSAAHGVLAVVATLTVAGARPVRAGEGGAGNPTLPGGTKSLYDSRVTFDPSAGGESCYLPGAAGYFCFRATTFSPDGEDVLALFERFPADWGLFGASVAGTPYCLGSGTWGEFNDLFIGDAIVMSHTRFHGVSDVCYAYYCVLGEPGSGYPGTWVSWWWWGTDTGTPPHHPCSYDGYTPAGYHACDEAFHRPAWVPRCQPVAPTTLTSAGCPEDPQTRTFTALNTTGTAMSLSLTYTVTSGIGTCTGPAMVTVPADGATPFEVVLTPGAAAPSEVACQIASVYPALPVYIGFATWGSLVELSLWDPAGWQNQTMVDAYPVYLAAAAAGTHPAATGPVAYYVGGRDSSGSVGALQIFDRAADAWTVLPGPAVYGAVASFIDGLLYVSGGFDGYSATQNLQVFDPATDTWDDTSYPDIPSISGRGGSSGGVGTCHTGVGQCHFHVGGGSGLDPFSVTFETWEYDPASVTWTRLDNLPNTMGLFGTALGGGVGCLGSVFYAGDQSGDHGFFRLDAASSSQWTELEEVPAEAGTVSPALVCREDEPAIYLIGGAHDSNWLGADNPKMFRYDLATEQWSGPFEHQLSTGAAGIAAVDLAGRLWTFGGTQQQWGDALPRHESLAYTSCSPLADLGATKTQSVPSAHPGDEISYQVHVGNDGPGDALGARVVDDLPGSLVNVAWTCTASAGSSCGATGGSGDLDQSVDLLIGGSVDYDITAVVDLAAAVSIANTVSVTPPAGTDDPDPIDNDAGVEMTVLAYDADLYVLDESEPCFYLPGDQADYTIVVGNRGPESPSGVELAATFPAELTAVTWTCTGSGGASCPASGSGPIAETVLLPAGTWVTFAVSGTVAQGATGAMVTTAEVIAPTSGDPNPIDNAAAHLDHLETTLFCDSVESGDCSVWSVTVP